jgi:hypothetical protein
VKSFGLQTMNSAGGRESNIARTEVSNSKERDQAESSTKNQ